jgi:hypothetical protein
MTDPADQQLLDQIHQLMATEHELFQVHLGEGHDPDVDAQLDAIDVEIDRQWDLLRQRRALRRAGRDPGGATLRPPGTVEGYQQ